jgi:hypothetical protein
VEISGIPLHPLVVHSAVVITPLSAFLTICAVVLPRFRYAFRWAAIGTTIMSAVLVWVATLSGYAMLSSHRFLRPLAEKHTEQGQWLAWSTLAFLLLVVTALPALSAPTGKVPLVWDSERNFWRPNTRFRRWSPVVQGVLEARLPTLLVAASVLQLVANILTTDSGVRIIWTP